MNCGRMKQIDAKAKFATASEKSEIEKSDDWVN